MLIHDQSNTVIVVGTVSNCLKSFKPNMDLRLDNTESTIEEIGKSQVK